MHLLLFDIDGTLTDTNDVDTSCFVQALRDVFALSEISTDWSAYPDATDSAITAHVVRDRLGRDPRPEELAKMKDRFHALVLQAFSDNPTLCRAVPGGPQFLETVHHFTNYAVAFGTGGWELTARLKLRFGGYLHSELPMASADDAHRRVEICSIAVERAVSHYMVSAFDSIVYIGDGIWDARAASDLGFRFLGVGIDGAATLKKAGAELVVPDFKGSKLLDHLLAVHKGT